MIPTEGVTLSGVPGKIELLGIRVFWNGVDGLVELPLSLPTARMHCALSYQWFDYIPLSFFDLGYHQARNSAHHDGVGK